MSPLPLMTRVPQMMFWDHVTEASPYCVYGWIVPVSQAAPTGFEVSG